MEGMEQWDSRDMIMQPTNHRRLRTECTRPGPEHCRQMSVIASSATETATSTAGFSCGLEDWEY